MEKISAKDSQSKNMTQPEMVLYSQRTAWTKGPEALEGATGLCAGESEGDEAEETGREDHEGSHSYKGF